MPLPKTKAGRMMRRGMVALVVGALAGCQGLQDNPKTAGGTVLGGIGGGVLGAQLAREPATPLPSSRGLFWGA